MAPNYQHPLEAETSPGWERQVAGSDLSRRHVMLRKTMIALFAAASVGMLAPSVASARGGGGGGGFVAAVEVASTVAGLVAAASAAAVLAEAVSVQSEAEVSVHPLSEAEASAQPLLGAVDFAVEPSEPMVSAAGGSTTTGAEFRSVPLYSGEGTRTPTLVAMGMTIPY